MATLGVVGLLLAYVMSIRPSYSEHLESAGIDQSKPSSSYDQKTNHFSMAPAVMEPIEGHETPFKVNQWNSYQV